MIIRRLVAYCLFFFKYLANDNIPLQSSVKIKNSFRREFSFSSHAAA